MSDRNKVTVSSQPAQPRREPADRRTAQLAAIANRQADLKREAAERRAARDARTPH